MRKKTNVTNKNEQMPHDETINGKIFAAESVGELQSTAHSIIKVADFGIEAGLLQKDEIDFIYDSAIEIIVGLNHPLAETELIYTANRKTDAANVGLKNEINQNRNTTNYTPTAEHNQSATDAVSRTNLATKFRDYFKGKLRVIWSPKKEGA